MIHTSTTTTLSDGREAEIQVSFTTRLIGGEPVVDDLTLDSATITHDDGEPLEWADGETIDTQLHGELKDASDKLFNELNEDSIRLDSLLEDDHFGN